MHRPTALLLAALLFAVPALADVETATIAISTTDSTVIDTRGRTDELYLILFPAAFTGATVSFKCSTSQNGTYSAIVDGTGAAISVTATVSSWVSLSSIAGSLAPCRFIKIVSASSEAAARTLTVMWK